jgi:hypothetical protein
MCSKQTLGIYQTRPHFAQSRARTLEPDARTIKSLLSEFADPYVCRSAVPHIIQVSQHDL